MACNHGKTRVKLGFPIAYTNFVSYPTHCSHLNVLAYHHLAQVVFPSIISTSKLQISILSDSTNTLVYSQNGKPVLATQVEPNRPYSIHFSPVYGGYVIEGLILGGSPSTVVEEESKPSKGVDKK